MLSKLPKFTPKPNKNALLAYIRETFRNWLVGTCFLIFAVSIKSPLADNLPSLIPERSHVNKTTKEVFGFAPYWVFNDKLNNLNFDVLTTFAYFGIPVRGDGTLDKEDYGYSVFWSKKATSIFREAHEKGTRVVVTLTQMDNATIQALLDDPEAKQNTVSEVLWEVLKRGVDGVNIDFEYTGDPGDIYRQKFTDYVAFMTETLHRFVPDSKVTVSVYAGSLLEPKLYDIGELAKVSDGIFMMAYDFATTSADQAMPTAPLYGHKTGTYWYDIATAVEDFLKIMPPEKLILGLPWYSYNYPVAEPKVKASTYRGATVQTYKAVQDEIDPGMKGIIDYKTGWDEEGQVGWKAYMNYYGTWRMVFFDDPRSLAIKYDFAKEQKLGGVGIWALGFDDGRKELWDILRDKFGNKIADINIIRKDINENI